MLGTAEYVAPETDLECWLATLWQEILNVDMIGLSDDYFDLGGDSLMAAALFVEVERRFGARLAPSTLLDHPTVAKLSELLRVEARAYAERCLIPLQAEGATPPLFLFHDLSGGLMSYRHLLRRLGTRRKLFGLQYPGQDENSTSVMSIAEMAATYVDAIRAVWPQGPYFLAGFSLGAQIAFETASQLTTAGGVVRLLALIDGPTREGKLRGLQRVARKLSRNLLYLSEERLVRWPGYLLGALRRELPLPWTKQRRPHREAAPNGSEDLLKMQTGKYLPPIYEGPVKVLRSVKGPGYWNHRNLGWEKYILGPIESFDIPDNHAAMMTEPMVALVAAYLEHWMKEAEMPGSVAQPRLGQ